MYEFVAGVMVGVFGCVFGVFLVAVTTPPSEVSRGTFEKFSEMCSQNQGLEKYVLKGNGLVVCKNGAKFEIGESK